MQRLNCELHALQGKSQPGAQCRVETGQVQPFVMHLGLDQISCHGCAMQQLYQDALCVCAEVRVKNTKMAGSGTDGKVAGGKGGGGKGSGHGLYAPYHMLGVVTQQVCLSDKLHRHRARWMQTSTADVVR